MKILANSCPKCGAPTHVIRDNAGKFIEIEPKEVELVPSDQYAADSVRGFVVHKSVCKKPKPSATEEKPEKPKRRASRRGLARAPIDTLADAESASEGGVKA